MANQQGQAFEDLRNTVGECTRIVRHRWRPSIIGLSLVGAVAFWCSQYLPREYSASTVFERRDDVVLQNLIQHNSPYGFEHLKTTMTRDMTGTRALAAAMVTTGLLPEGALTSEAALTEGERNALDAALGRYKLTPSVRLIHSTDALDTVLLKCTANDPVVARQLVVALRDNYTAETTRRIRDILSGTKEFFATEVQRLQQKVVEAERDLRVGFAEFQGVDPTDRVGVGNRLEMIRAQRDEIFQRVAEQEAEVAAREDFLRSAPPPYALEPEETGTSAGPGVAVTENVNTTIDRAIESVQQEIVDAFTVRRMTKEHPSVRALYARLNALQDLRTDLLAMTAEPESVEPSTARESHKMSAAYLHWQNQKARVEIELDALRRQSEVSSAKLAEAEDRLQTFGALYKRMVADDDTLRRLLDQRAEGSAELGVWQGHLSRLERVLAAESGERGTQFTLVEEPEGVAHPTSPRIASIFVVCSGLGLAAAALLVALAELFDRSFRSVGQVTRALGLPVLECIGVVATPRERRRAMLSRLIWTPTMALLLLSLVACAGLAYASLEMPGMHARAMQRVDRALQSIGMTASAATSDHAR